MRFPTMALLAALSALLSAPAPAEAQAACELYRVQRGESLAEIATRVYGDPDYGQIWRENRAEIGRNPDIVRVGTVLRLPCPEGSPPQSAPAAPGAGGDVSFVTANGYLPYTDESLFQSGLVTQLVRQAMLRGAPEKSVEIVFVNDWAAHLETLLPRMAFDGSFPWTRPDCGEGAARTTAEDYACLNYVYSDPLYEIVEGFFSRPGLGFETLVNFDGMKGATLCRPEGYPTGHLGDAGLMPPDVVLVTPATPHACFERLLTGSVDVVALDTRSGERAMSDLGLTFEIAENPHLYSIQPLQVALHKDNPRSAELIADINRGLADMLATGEWASIVSEGLREHAGALVN